MVSAMAFLPLMVLLALLAPTRGDKCFTCASPELKEHWQLVGYPYRYPADKYKDRCAKAQEKPGAQTVTPAPGDPADECPTYCVTIFITAMNDEGKKSEGDYWAVRGCYDKLMGDAKKAETTLTGGTELKTKKRTEKGTITVYKNDSSKVDLDMIITSCKVSGNSYCNIEAPDTFDTCEEATLCYAPTVTDTSCIMSQPDGKSLSAESGKHCLKSDVTVNGWNTIVRSKSSLNPFVPPASKYPEGKTETTGSICVYYQDGFFSPPGGYNQVRARTCYCNDQKECNGGNRLSSIAVFLLAMPIVLYFFKSW